MPCACRWLTHGELVFEDHCAGVHDRCCDFLFYSTCKRQAAGIAQHQDVAEVRQPWSLFDDNPTLPRGIAKLARLLLRMYTLSSAFQKRAESTIQFGRTSNLVSTAVALRHNNTFPI
jgi:hypothetical protein